MIMINSKMYKQMCQLTSLYFSWKWWYDNEKNTCSMDQ